MVDWTEGEGRKKGAHGFVGVCGLLAALAALRMPCWNSRSLGCVGRASMFLVCPCEQRQEFLQCLL